MKKTILSIVMAALCLIFKAHAQSDTTSAIRGKIIDQRGQPLPGATIKIKGSSLAGSSDEQGRFNLSGAQKEGVLLISFLGYLSQELPFGDGNGRDSLRIVMREDENALREVEINAGYYTVKDRERTGSIARVGAGTIARQPVSNVLGALIGRMPGVNIEQQSGINGGGFKVEIRGINSLRPEGRQPLYLVDGVPYPASPMTNAGISVEGISLYASPINYLSPSDIESIEVLKDADATAIYGSRGANGVVLIRTKRAKVGKTSLDVNFNSGFSAVGTTIGMMNTQQYLEMRREAFVNDGTVPGSTAYDVNGSWDPDRYTDWQKELIGGSASQLNAQATVSGGNEGTQFSWRTNFSKHGTVSSKDFDEQKGASSLVVNHRDASGKFKANFSMTYGLDKNRLPLFDLAKYIDLSPNAPALYDGQGKINWALNDNGEATWVNPIAAFEQPYTGITTSTRANGQLNYELLRGLFLRSNLGYSDIRVKEDLLGPIRSQPPSEYAAGYHIIEHNGITTWIVEPQINYQRDLGRGKLDLLLGSTFQQDNQKSEELAGNSYATDLLLGSITAAPGKYASSSSSLYRYSAVFARANYNFEGRYLMNLTGRRDGSSRFGPGRQFANFGALRMAWVFSEEQWLKEKFSLLSYGKLRGSYGITGSDQIPNYGYLETYTVTIYPYQDGSGLFPSRLANPDYSWETNKKLELALDLGFLKDVIMLSASWYRNRSSDQLVGYSLPDLAGFPSVQYNLPATVENRGWELELNTVNLRRNDFSWRSSLNITLPENKLLAYPNIKGSTYANIYTVGESLFMPRTYRYLGVDRETGLYQFEDLNGNNQRDVADRVPAGKALTSTAYGGLTNSLSFRGFALELFVQLVKKTAKDPLLQFSSPGSVSSTFGGNQPLEVIDRWRQSGDDATIQRVGQTFSSGSPYQLFTYLNTSDRFVDASFVRLKNLSLSWNAPARWIKKSGLQGLRFYLQGQNLFTITDYLGDPEVLSLKTLPSLKTYTAGIQLNL